jgi:hypothetical protein
MQKLGTAYPIRIGTMFGRGMTIFPPLLKGGPTLFEAAQAADASFHHLADRIGASGVIPILNEEGKLSGAFVPEDVVRDLVAIDLGIDWETLEAVHDGIFSAMAILMKLPTIEMPAP